MSYSVFTIPPFDRQIKRLVKKYPSLLNEFADLMESLEHDPKQGTNLGNDCFKIRIAIESKGKGKSSGARIITNIFVEDKIVYLLSIYDKSEKDNLSNKELEKLLNEIR